MRGTVRGTVRMRGRIAALGCTALCAALLLGGCTVGPDFHRPDPQAPAHWWRPGAGSPVASAVVDDGPVDVLWWDSFGDPELSSLERRLAAQNLPLQAAAERVRQGRAQRRIAASEGLPTLDANASYDRVRAPPQVLGALVVPAPGAPTQFDFWQDSLSSAWELDLFGRVRRQVEAERANTEAAVETRRGVALMAVSDLAQDYMQLRGAQAMRAITESSLADASRNAALVRNQFANGVSTTLDIANAQAQRAMIASTLPQLRTTEAQLINAIGTLLAEPPRALAAELRVPASQPPVPPAVPIGVPAELARRRPDVREAEALLHAATAQTGVAVAAFYPDVRLSGQIGTQALQFPQLFNLYSGLFLVGPTVDVPIFEGGRLRATLHLRQSQQRQAAIEYRDTVLGAWQDVDNAMTAYAEAQRRHQAIDEAVRQDRLALAAARQRYRQGVVDFLNVLSAQNALLQNQDALAGSSMQIETDLVALYRALGGGWQIAEGETQAAGRTGP